MRSSPYIHKEDCGPVNRNSVFIFSTAVRGVMDNPELGFQLNITSGCLFLVDGDIYDPPEERESQCDGQTTTYRDTLIYTH